MWWTLRGAGVQPWRERLRDGGGGFRVGTISLRAKVGVLMVVTSVNISRSEPYISCGEYYIVSQDHESGSSYL